LPLLQNLDIADFQIVDMSVLGCMMQFERIHFPPLGKPRIRGPSSMSNRASRGLTLIELMVTLCVAVVLMAIAAPSFQQLIATNQLRTTSNELAVALAYARSEAVKRGWPTTICASTDTPSASPSCSGGNNWGQGWLVFVDYDGSGTAATSAGYPNDVLLRVGGASVSGLVVTPSTNFFSYINYDPRGGPAGTSSGGGSFAFCLGGMSRTLSINTTGRLVVQQGTCP